MARREARTGGRLRVKRNKKPSRKLLDMIWRGRERKEGDLKGIQHMMWFGLNTFKTDVAQSQIPITRFK